MRDLIEKLNQLQLNEAPVQPGERKGISFKLKKLEKLTNELNNYKGSLNSMKYMELPANLKSEMKQIEDKLSAEIDKVNQAYQVEYEKSKANDRPVKMDNLFKALAKHCKEIIKVYKELNRNDFQREKFLFRGIRSTDDAVYGKPFIARKPKDSNRELHELVNGTINSLGFDANRENSMFVTGDRSQASGYGNDLYIMFPVDGFTFTWSQTVKDLILDSNKKLEMMDKEVTKQLREMVKQAKLASAEPSSFPISDPDDLFYSGYSYDHDYERVARAIDDGKVPDEAQDLLDNILTNKSIQEHFEFSDQDLFKAILSEKEIYVKGDYYAVNINHKQELFKFLAEINTDDVELPENVGEVPDILDKGDVVTILSGTNAGKLGTITYVYSDSYEVFVNHKVGDTTLKKDQVELYKLPDGSLPLFEKNDEVIIVDPVSRLYGQVVKLNFVYANGKVEFTDKNSNYHTAYKNQIEPYSLEREQAILKDIETRPPEINENDLVIVSDPESPFYKERGKVNYIYSTGTIEVKIFKTDQFIDFEASQLVLLDNAPPELLQQTEGEFHEGDKVQITSGEYQGYYGKITYLYSNTKKAEVDLTGMDQKVDIWLSELAHQDQGKAKTTFKVGDTVQVIEPDSSYYQQQATVIEVGQTDMGQPTVTLKSGDTEYKTFASWVKNLSAEFKPGETVKIIKGKHEGKTGTIVLQHGTSNIYDVTIDGTDYEMEASEMQRSEQTAAPVRFGPGDTIKVKGKSYEYDGAVATVVKGPDADGDYQVVTKKEGKILFLGAEQMEPTQDTDAIKIGDMVKITDKTSGFFGEIGEVESGPDNDGDFVVRFPEDEWSYYNLTGMVKVNQSPAASTTSDEIDSLNWEPEPEPQAPNFPLQVNDRVEVTSQFPSLIGMKGTIMQVTPKFGFVSVQLDGNSDPSSFPVSALTKIEDTPAEQTVADFKKGDMVQITNNKISTFNMQGKVIDINPSYLFVEFPDQTEAAVKPTSVKKIG